MSLKRVAKTLAALSGGQGINLINNLLLPPIFLRHYSVAVYGEWLTLSAAVAYLVTLNFGLQTYANNQVAICYHQGDLEEAHTLQATALAILLAIVTVAALATSLVFILPVNQWLGMKSSHSTVSLTLYLLGLQMLGKIIFGFLSGTFLVVGAAHRGQQWNNALQLATTLATALQAMFSASFPSIAAQQLVMAAVFTLLVLFDLRTKAAPVFPRLRYVKLKRFGDVAGPSGYFGMLLCATFLSYQLPVMLIQRILGPTTVVVFSLTRTIFSMARSSLVILSQAIGPEINQLYGQRNWQRLLTLYEKSERVVFAAVPLATIGTLLATPLLLAAWLHKPGLYSPGICVVMGLISGILGIKEHKFQFQYSSNEHISLARMTFWSYLAMEAISFFGLHRFGIMGFLIPWLATEIYQTLSILKLNLKLFGHIAALDFSPVYKLFALMGVAIVPGTWFAFTAPQRSLLHTSLIALASCIVLAAVSYRLFGLNDIKQDILYRFKT
jgi:O-antigen/teichoic acid export membrane protein